MHKEKDDRGLHLPSPVTVILALASILPNWFWASQTYTASSSTHRSDRRRTTKHSMFKSEPFPNACDFQRRLDLRVMCSPPLLWATLPSVRGLLKRRRPSSLLQVICGSGYPWARHSRVTSEPMSNATSDGSRVNLGTAVGFKVEDGKGQNPSEFHSTDTQTLPDEPGSSLRIWLEDQVPILNNIEDVKLEMLKIYFSYVNFCLYSFVNECTSLLAYLKHNASKLATAKYN